MIYSVQSANFEKDLLSGSMLFKADWYLKTYPDVRKAGMDPLDHYIAHGAREGRKPSPEFDSSLYLMHNPEAKGSGLSPLAHFLLNGVNRAQYLISEQGNTPQDLDVPTQQVFKDLLRYSHEEDRILLENTRFFNEEVYKLGYPGVDWSLIMPIDHYLSVGGKDGARTSSTFDGVAYRSRHPELGAEVDPLLHFLRRGAYFLESSIFFDSKWYLHTYPDVAKAAMDPLFHYIEFGANEGRNPSSRFIGQLVERNFPHDVRAGEPPVIDFLFRRFADLTGVDDLRKMRRGNDAANSDGYSSRKRRRSGPIAVFVTHDLNMGGAPILLHSIVSWFVRFTNYRVKVVALGNGNLAPKFSEVAPLTILGKTTFGPDEIAPTKKILREFLGEQPAFTFMSSVASANYCDVDPFSAPRIAYIHEMAKILDMYRDCATKIRACVDTVICGSSLVKEALVDGFGFDRELLEVRPAFINIDEDQALIAGREKAVRRKALGWLETKPLVAACGVAHWRKQPDAFVRIAAKVIRDKSIDANFVWIGDGDDVDHCRQLAIDLGIADSIKFLGHQQDITPFLRAASAFALTSSEDPFPLVCLDAVKASCPCVVYAEATGFTDVVAPTDAARCGFAVELNDESAFADRLVEILTSEQLRETLAGVGLSRVQQSYSVDAGCQELLSIIRKAARLQPEVSVVLPNYNYEKYLDVRLRSIVQQDFRDVEILLLDDASTDASVRILEDFCSKYSHSSLFVAEKNNGSVFKAWEKGIQLAKGRFIWIAEADDWCEDTFLSQVLERFQRTGTLLSYGRSIPIDAEGTITGDWNDLYLDQLVPGRWTRSYYNFAQSEVDTVLGWANSIPNASAVVVEANAARQGIASAVNFKLAGDWAFYLASIAGGVVSYCHEAINYHRRHVKSVTHSVEGKEEYFQELADIGALGDSLYGRSVGRQQVLHGRISSEAKRFGYKGTLPRANVASFQPRKLPGILYGVGDLGPGGAQIFAVRFANEWKRRGGNVTIFLGGTGELHASSTTKLLPGIPIVSFADIQKEGSFTAFMGVAGLDVIVSGHWWADRALGSFQDEAPDPFPWLTIMHGCYENVLSTPDAFPDMKEVFNRSERNVSHWVWTAKKNKNVFEQGFIQPRSESHITSGFQGEVVGSLKRSDLGIPEDAVVFTIASRAIVSKGWLATLEAFKDATVSEPHGKPAHLLMIGDGPVLEEINEASIPPSVTLVPHVSNLADYISISDVCVLPSWFAGESLPLVLIEFLSQGKPAIVSTIGECGWCITDEDSGKVAGFILERDAETGEVSPTAISGAMIEIMRNGSIFEQMSQTATLAFRKFEIDRMMNAYISLINRLRDNRAQFEPERLGINIDFFEREAGNA